MNYLSYLINLLAPASSDAAYAVYRTVSAVFIILMFVAALAAIVLVLLQPGNSQGIDAVGGHQGEGGVLPGGGVVGQAGHHGLDRGEAGVFGGDAQGEGHCEVAQGDGDAVPHPPPVPGESVFQGCIPPGRGPPGRTKSARLPVPGGAALLPKALRGDILRGCPGKGDGPFSRTHYTGICREVNGKPELPGRLSRPPGGAPPPIPLTKDALRRRRRRGTIPEKPPARRTGRQAVPTGKIAGGPRGPGSWENIATERKLPI